MTPYERLLGDAMEGDPLLFAREDGVEAAWRVVDRVLTDHGRRPPLPAEDVGAGARPSALLPEGDYWHDPRP